MKPESAKLWARSVYTAGMLLAILFIPAGTLAWPEAWVLFVLFVGFSFGVFFWLKKNNPGLFRERTARGKKSKPWDKVIVAAYSLLNVAILVVAGLDHARFGWSRVPVLLRVTAFLGLVPPALIIVSAMKHNPFTSDVVRIQEDRGHRVCSDGPYRFVRHPWYIGVILIALMIPLSLGSFYALIPAALVAFLFILRTALEDKTLREELPGYQEYSRVVRYRLVPGIW